jgi:hypothetical protein
MVPGRLARGHSRRCRLPRFPLSPSTFLRPFAPDPLQTLLSSYGRSDSCPPRSWTLSLNACSTYGQGSLIHAPGLPTILSPTTCGRSVSPRYATFRRIESRSLPYGSSPYGNSRLRHSLATSPHLAGRIEFLSYGLAVHLRLLSTPSRDDAVTFGYPKSARKNGSGDVDAIFCASRGGRVVGGRYYLHPGTAGYADRGFDWRGRAEGTAWQRPRKRPGGRPRRTYAS